MAGEISTKAELIAKGDSAFSELTVEQRDRVLVRVAGSLHYTALIWRAVHDKAAKDIERLAEKIDREHQEIAADYSPSSGEVLYRAVELLDGFHRRMSS
jgi:DNA-directed RNA polymerase alpha subunit